MNSLQKYLIEICRAYLEKREVSLRDDADYNDFYALSKVHNLSGVVFCVLNTAPNKHIVPQDVLKCFESDFLEAVVRYDFQSGQIAEIGALCEKEGVRFVFTKGAAIRKYFPVPEARAMGDVDVLIDTDNRERLKALLCENGYDCRNSNGNVYEYTKDGLLTEVHTRIISGKIGENDLEGAFADAIDHAEFDGCRGVLEVNYHFAYLIAHIAHHFWFYGAGVKLILDLAVMLKSCEIDLEKVLDILSACNLQNFAKTVLTLTYKWFGAGRDFGADTLKTEEFILSYGAFGNSGRNKAAVVMRKDIEGGGSGSGFGAKIRLLFPSYEKMRNIPYIGFIEGRRYLVPAAWMYRIYYNLKNRREFVRSATADLSSDETKKEAERELAFFEEIGLL